MEQGGDRRTQRCSGGRRVLGTVEAEGLDRALASPQLIYHLSCTWAAGQSRSSGRLPTTSDPARIYCILLPRRYKGPYSWGRITGHLLRPTWRSLGILVTLTSFHLCLSCLANSPSKSANPALLKSLCVLWQVVPIILALSCQALGSLNALTAGF